MIMMMYYIISLISYILDSTFLWNIIQKMQEISVLKSTNSSKRRDHISNQRERRLMLLSPLQDTDNLRLEFVSNPSIRIK